MSDGSVVVPANPPLTRLRRWLLRTPRAERVDLSGRKIVVTGASPGSIGFQTARILASWNASVVITTRSDPQAALKALRHSLAGIAPAAALDAQPLDLCQAASVAAFADWYRQHHGERLDVLLNNAGVHLDLLSRWKEPKLTADSREIHWRTNYLGTQHLTHRLLPLLSATARRNGEARVVNLVSRLHHKGSNAGLFDPPQHYDSWVAYGLSKLALVHATFELQRRYAAQGVHAYCLHPGAVLSHIADKGLEDSRLLGGLRKALRPIEAFFLLSPEEGAQTSVHCATCPGLAGGLYYERCQPAQPSADSLDATVAARLWDATAGWCSTLAQRS